MATSSVCVVLITMMWPPDDDADHLLSLTLGSMMMRGTCAGIVMQKTDLE